MKIGDVAKQLNISSSTIRFYEKEGLIEPPHRVSGKRDFSDHALITLRFIQLCQAAGFTISEIRNLLENYSKDSTTAGLWQPAVVKKQRAIKDQLQELKEVDAILDELMACRCESIEQCVGFALQDSRWVSSEK